MRLYSRETNLDNAYILHIETVEHTPLYINVCGSYLLVYTTENVLNIYNIITRSSENANPAAMNSNATVNVARLERVRRIAFGNVVARVTRVRGISLFGSHVGGKDLTTQSSDMDLITRSLDQMSALGDVINANIVILVDGKLIMLSPRVPVCYYSIGFNFAFMLTVLKEDDDDSDLTGQAHSQSHYDLNVLCEKTEYYWISRKSVANLWTSIWAIDGKGIMVNILGTGMSGDIELKDGY